MDSSPCLSFCDYAQAACDICLLNTALQRDAPFQARSAGCWRKAKITSRAANQIIAPGRSRAAIGSRGCAAVLGVENLDRLVQTKSWSGPDGDAPIVLGAPPTCRRRK